MSPEQRRALEAKKPRPFSSRDKLVASYAELVAGKKIILGALQGNIGILSIDDRQRAHRIIEDLHALAEAIAKITNQY